MYRLSLNQPEKVIEDKSSNNCNPCNKLNIIKTTCQNPCNDPRYKFYIKPIDYLERIDDNIAIILTIIYITTFASSTIQTILNATILIYEELLIEIKKYKDYEPLYSKLVLFDYFMNNIKNLGTDKIQSTEILQKILEQQNVILLEFINNQIYLKM